MRVKRGVKARKRRNRMFKLAEGFRGRSKNTIRQTTQRAEKSLQYEYRDRKVRKRDFRSLWITRINAAVRKYGITYGQFMHGLKKANVMLDRKVLADMGAYNEVAFAKVVETARAALAK